MALAAILQSLDGLPEALAKEYARQADGMYRLEVEGGFKTADEVTGLVSALDKERSSAKEAQARLKAFDGIDPAEARKALATVGNLDSAMKKQSEDLEATFQARLAPVEERAVKAEKDLQAATERLNTHLIGNAFANASVIKEMCHDGMHPEVVRRVLAPHVAVEDGELVFRDEAGNKILDMDGRCKPNEAIKKLLTGTDAGKSLLRPVAGSGSQPGSGMGRPGTMNPWKKEHWNVTQQSEIAAKDLNEAKRLAGEAGITLG